MEEIVFGCPGSPNAMLALRVASSVGSSLNVCRAVILWRIAYVERRRERRTWRKGESNIVRW